MPTESGIHDLVADGAVSVTEAVRITGLSRSFLYKLMEGGQLEYMKIGKARRIPRRALLDLMARSLVGRR
jgi:excisionase family DNA binding protein